MPCPESSWWMKMAEFASMTMKDLKGYLSTDEVHRLLDAAKNPRDRLILQMMYRCGRRVSEVLAINKDDILWNENKIIFNILKRKRPTKELKPVDSETMSMLKEYVFGSPDLASLKKGGVDEKGLLFPVSRQYVFKMIRELGMSVGITHVGSKGLHPHHLRHSFAVHQVKSNIKSADDLRKLQMYMGHANLSTTAHYLQFSPDELRDVVDGMWGDNGKPPEKKGGEKDSKPVSE
jgi:integrase/recombinase XerD